MKSRTTSQGEEERRSQHARIGEAVEQVYADRLPEHFGVLAHHFTRASDGTKPSSICLPRPSRPSAPLPPVRRSPSTTMPCERLNGWPAAWASRILLFGIHEAKARLYFVTSDFKRSAAEGERILPLARLTGNRVKEAEALATVAWASIWAPNLDAAIRFAREALAVAEPVGALAVQGRAHYIIGFIRGVTGVLDESQTSAEKPCCSAPSWRRRSTGHCRCRWPGCCEIGPATTARPSPAERRSRTRAGAQPALSPLLFSCFMRGLTLTGKGDYDEALASFNEGLSLAERIGDEAIHHRLLNCLGWLYADLGDLDHAETLNATSAKIGRRRGDPGTQPNAELNLAEIFRARGELSRAEEQYDGVFRYWKNPCREPVDAVPVFHPHVCRHG